MTETIVYEDLYYQVEYAWEEDDAKLDFIAYRIESFGGSGTELSKNAALEGYIKFDGCMNVKMEEGYAHFCGRYMTKQYGELFDRLYDKAKEIGFDD